MATVKYTVTFVPNMYAQGTRISYRKDTTNVWTIPSNPANPTTLSTYPLELEENSTYYIAISSTGKNCTEMNVIKTVITPALSPCCPDGFTLSSDESYCFKEETTDPIYETQNICVAISQLTPEYSVDGTKLFQNISDYDTRLRGPAQTLTTAYWNGNPAGAGANSTGNPASPMNRLGIWIDSDCDGKKDPLKKNSLLQFTVQLLMSSSRQVYVGIAGDNTFRLVINGVTIVDCDQAAPAGGGSNPVFNFTNFWLFPVMLLAGANLVSFQFIGDGSNVDAAACAIYDNSMAELVAATADSEVTFLFKSTDMLNQRIDIATCPSGFTLDTGGGSGNYTCRQITIMDPILCP